MDVAQRAHQRDGWAAGGQRAAAGAARQLAPRRARHDKRRTRGFHRADPRVVRGRGQPVLLDRASVGRRRHRSRRYAHGSGARPVRSAQRGHPRNAVRRLPHVIDSVLVANRGEIAVRIFRTCRRLGLRTIAVYSDADAQALHVAEADEAYWIGPSPVGQSYLSAAAILAAARRAGAQAIHPGYGFLAENADFAEAVVDAGFLWVGPPASAMRVLGDKARAKLLAEQHGVPLLPGYHGEDQASSTLVEHAARIGYPVLIKAAAGGGGRGMRVVERAAEFDTALAAARREALSSFGVDRVLLERYVRRPRHVEVQILGDRYGHLIHLGERECSIQRRYQKLIEETPSPGVDADLRGRITEAALRLGRAAGYANAGTVEFLLDEQGEFAFLEVNTRLQVEHPVTEAVTGLDLVELQLRIAAGEPLPTEARQAAITGHAIEVRLYAEDVPAGFLPVTGTLHRFAVPSGPGLRVDTGYGDGSRISRTTTPCWPRLSRTAGPARTPPAAWPGRCGTPRSTAWPPTATCWSRSCASRNSWPAPPTPATSPVTTPPPWPGRRPATAPEPPTEPAAAL